MLRLLAVQTRTHLSVSLPAATGQACFASRGSGGGGGKAGRSSLPLVNEAVTASRVRVIDASGQQLGVLSRREALQAAGTQGLDLIEVSPTAEPPVCRLGSWNEYRASLKQKQTLARKKARAGRTETKEVRFGSQMSEHDLQHRLRQVTEFLKRRQLVKVSLLFRGSGAVQLDVGRAMLQRVVDHVQQYGAPDSESVRPKLHGRFMTLVLYPGKISGPNGPHVASNEPDAVGDGAESK